MSVGENNVCHDEDVSLVKIGPGWAPHMHVIKWLCLWKEHAKWCPVTIAIYRCWPIPTLDQDQIVTLSIYQLQYLVDVFSDRILTLDEATREVGGS